MRAYYFLLIAATTFLATSDFVSATSNVDKTKLSQVTSPDAQQSIDDNIVVPATKRLLRRNKTEEEEDGDAKNDLDDEDRVFTFANVADEVMAKAVGTHARTVDNTLENLDNKLLKWDDAVSKWKGASARVIHERKKITDMKTLLKSLDEATIKHALTDVSMSLFKVLASKRVSENIFGDILRKKAFLTMDQVNDLTQKYHWFRKTVS